MGHRKHAHCGYCGHRFVEGQPWPRRCRRCRRDSYLNPMPVVLLLLPVQRRQPSNGPANGQGHGLLLIRRNIAPHVGRLALPGGYIEIHETWQAAAARELWEEAGIRISDSTVREFRVRSAESGLILIFGQASPIHEDDLPPFVANPEVSERVIVHEANELGFPLHSQAVQDFFTASR